MTKRRVRFYYDPEYDRDIHKFLEAIPPNKISGTMRRVIRAHVSGSGEGLEHTLRKILREELSAVAIQVAPGEAAVSPGEDDETRQTLDGLADAWEA